MELSPAGFIAPLFSLQAPAAATQIEFNLNSH
jgi:hypothetical protein